MKLTQISLLLVFALLIQNSTQQSFLDRFRAAKQQIPTPRRNLLDISTIDGQIISLQNEYFGKFYGSGSRITGGQNPHNDDSNIRFKVERIDQTQKFYLKSEDTGSYCGMEDNDNYVPYLFCGSGILNGSWSRKEFQLNGPDESGSYTIKVNGNRIVTTSENGETMYGLTPSYWNQHTHYKDGYKKWKLFINDCDIGAGEVQTEIGGSCVTTCPSQFTKGTYVCTPDCGTGCNSCSGSECTSCHDDFVLNGDNCKYALDFLDKVVKLKGKRFNKYCRDLGSDTVKCDQGNIGDEEKFTIERADSGYVTLKGGSEGKYCVNDNERLECDGNTLNDAAKWKMYFESDSRVSFKSVSNDMFMSVQKKKKKKRVYVNASNISKNQKFDFEY